MGFFSSFSGVWWEPQCSLFLTPCLRLGIFENLFPDRIAFYVAQIVVALETRSAQTQVGNLCITLIVHGRFARGARGQ